MQRFLKQALIKWAQADEYRPIILRGPRQVGKSYLVEEFGQEYFENLCIVNFEKRPEAADCFDTLDPKEILTKLALQQGEVIRPGKTLLFLDEVQQCPQALQALRYFKEEMPSLHLIAAGSLLEFALADKDFKMPVGRVEYWYLKPLSFLEFLQAQEKLMWVEAIQHASLAQPLPKVLHDALTDQIKLYLSLGGMPAVLSSYIDQGPGEAFHRMQMSILETYRDDFAKYATRAQVQYMQTVFSQLPSLVGEMTKYKKIDPDTQSRFLKQAIHCLEMAGVVTRVYASKASGVPVGSLINYQKYKLYFLDVGLLSAQSGLNRSMLLEKDIMLVNRGELAEQYVCQELLAAQPSYQQAANYCWVREKAQSMAEVDFLMQQGTKVIPIEVKAGKTGRLRSLQIFMEEKQAPIGVRVCQQVLSYDEQRNILTVPFYLVSEIGRLVALQLKTKLV